MQKYLMQLVIGVVVVLVGAVSFMVYHTNTTAKASSPPAAVEKTQ
jgi:uncharacterized membrane protein